MLREQRQCNATDRVQLLKTITSQEIFSKEPVQQFSSEPMKISGLRGLKFNKVDCVCTAYFKGDYVEQAWKQTLPKKC